MSFESLPKLLLRVAAVAMIASASGGCSSVPGWLNPFGDSDEPTTASDEVGAPAQTVDSGTTPDLADVPDRPAQTATADSENQVVASLSADRSRAKYSADTLRGDATAAAAPPAAPSPTDTTDTSQASDTAQAEPAPADTTTADTTPATTDSAVPPQVAADSAPSTETRTAGTMPAVPPSSATPVASSPTPSYTPAVASSTAPSGGAPAVPPTSTRSAPSYASSYAASPVGQPAVPQSGSAMAAATPMSTRPMSDAQLGFQQSAAPPLDASVAQFVSPAIMSRYRQTAGGGGVAVASAAVPSSASRRSRTPAMGGPEQMTGSVVANLDPLSDAPAASSPSVYANTNGMPATSVVFFPGDTTVLNASARAQVRAAVDAYRASGGTGFIRVVGHSSSRTGNMPLERHLVVIFEKSQQRANSVAQELIRQGIPASKVLVEAVGDSQPVYYESMPKGEDGNRRAEIFLQS
jgi:outer membrane protein OmpA-like peptidoglycan-associated protein